MKMAGVTNTLPPSATWFFLTMLAIIGVVLFLDIRKELKENKEDKNAQRGNVHKGDKKW